MALLGGKRHEPGFSDRKNMVDGEDRKSSIVADWGGKQNQTHQMGPDSREALKPECLSTWSGGQWVEVLAPVPGNDLSPPSCHLSSQLGREGLWGLSDSVVLLKHDELKHNDYVDEHESRKGRIYPEAFAPCYRSIIVREVMPQTSSVIRK